MKVSELKEGMLVVPVEGKGWCPVVIGPNLKKMNRAAPYMKTNFIRNCKIGRDPAIYMGKIRFEEAVHGLYTYHQILYNGIIYFIDGYEFNGRINPL
tara:strand:+ start:105 stop:395 length:291 start_codon:yes stop_codon:yes gene_type:complete